MDRLDDINTGALLVSIDWPDILTEDSRQRIIDSDNSKITAKLLWKLNNLGIKLKTEVFEAIMACDITQLIEIERIIPENRINFLGRKRTFYEIEKALIIFLVKYIASEAKNVISRLIGWDIDDLLKPLERLYEASLLTKENCDIFLKGEFSRCKSILESIQMLDEEKILNKKNFEAIKNHDDPLSLVASLRTYNDIKRSIYMAIEKKGGRNAKEKTERANSLFRAIKKILIAHNQPKLLAEAFEILHYCRLLTSGNIQAIANHSDLELIVKALHIFDSKNEFKKQTEDKSQKIFNIIIQAKEPINLVNAIYILLVWHIHTDENIQAIVSHREPQLIIDALFNLEKTAPCIKQEKSEIAQEIFNEIIQAGNPSALAKAIAILRKEPILRQDQEKLNSIKKHQNPLGLANAYALLRGVYFSAELGRTIQDALEKHIAPESFAKAVVELVHIGRGMLKRALDSVLNTPEPEEMVQLLNNILIYLDRAHILEDGNVDLLFHQDNRWLLTWGAYFRVWARIPTYQLTQEVFNELVRQAPEPDRAVLRYVDQLLGVEQAEEVEDAINYMQSTHNTSVHESCSQSARKLAQLYRQSLNEVGSSFIIQQVSDHISCQPNNLGRKRYIEQAFLEIIETSFHDQVSGISNKELLCFAWLAIHDKEKRTGSVDVAEERFREGLYEIGHGEDGMSICSSGAFNKLIEKLVSLHPACEVNFITRATVSGRLKCIVKDEAKKYLSHPQNANEYLDFIAKIEELQNGLGSIWGAIRNTVSRQLFEDFESFFEYQQNDFFNEIVDNGVYAELSNDDKAEILRQIQHSPGYQQYKQASQRSGAGRFFEQLPTKNDINQSTRRNSL